MKTPMEELIRTDGNREAIEQVEAITQAREYPVHLFIVGPEESGKTEIVRARQLDKDLLSTKRVLYRPCRELPDALRNNVYESYLDDLVEYEVLMLDEFEGFWEDEELGVEMFKLMLLERNRRGLDTVITSRKPLDSFDLSKFGELMDDFREIRIEKLAGDEMIRYAEMLQEIYFIEGTSPVLSEEALRYFALEMDISMEMMRKAMHYLMTQYQGTPGEELSAQFVQKALERQE